MDTPPESTFPGGIFDSVEYEICGHYLRNKFGGSLKDTSMLIQELWESRELSEKHPGLLLELKQIHVWQTMMKRYADEAGVNPYDVYQLYDLALMAVVKAFYPKDCLDKKNIPTIAFTDIFKEEAKSRSDALVRLIQDTSAPISIKFWSEDVAALQTDLIAEMELQPTFYKKRIFNCDFTSSIYYIFNQVFLNTKMSLGSFSDWNKRLLFCRDYFASDLIQIVANGEVTDRISPELVLTLARLRISFNHIPVDICLGLKAREVLFVMLSTRKLRASYAIEKSSYGIDSMSKSLSAMSLSSKSYFGMLGMIIGQLRDSVTEMWTRKKQDRVSKEKIVKLSHCLDHIRLTIVYLSRRFDPLLQKIEETAEGMEGTTMTILHLYVVANLMLKEMIPQDASSKQVFEAHLGKTTELKSGFSKTAEVIYNLLESEYNKLYSTDSILACGLFSFLELSRGLALLGDKLLEQFGSMSLEEMSHFHYFSSEYITYCLRRGIVKVNNIDIWDVHTLSAQTRSNFQELIMSKTLPKKADHSFYEFLRLKTASSEDEPFWTEVGKWLDERDEEIKSSWTANIGTPQKSQKPVPQPQKKISLSPRIVKLESQTIEELPHSTVEEQAIVPMASDQSLVRAQDENRLDITTPSPKASDLEIFSPFNAEEKQALQGLSEIWANASKKLFSEVPRLSIPRPIIQRRPLALTHTALEEPRQHLMLAKSVGYQYSSVDPRDYLLALILIGERCRYRLQSFVSILGAYSGYEAVPEMFKEDIDGFKEEVKMLAEINPSLLEELLDAAGIIDLETLLKYIDYYQIRVKVTHPFVSKTKPARDFVASRHLTTLERLEAFNATKLRTLMGCNQYIPVKTLEIQPGRPSNLLSSKHTEITLAVIGLYEMTNFAGLRKQRNDLAHQTVDQATFEAYVKYAFGKSADFEILKRL